MQHQDGSTWLDRRRINRARRVFCVRESAHSPSAMTDRARTKTIWRISPGQSRCPAFRRCLSGARLQFCPAGPVAGRANGAQPIKQWTGHLFQPRIYRLQENFHEKTYRYSRLEQRKKTTNRRQFITTGVGMTVAAALPSLASSTAFVRCCTRRTTTSWPTDRYVLIINAHQIYRGISEGRLNKTMAGLIAEEMRMKNYEVKTTHGSTQLRCLCRHRQRISRVLPLPERMF
jgi:hypothetical protein